MGVPGWLRYALAVLVAAAATGIGWDIAPDWSASGGHPYLIAWPAIMLAAWIGGLGPGLLATALFLGEMLCSFGPFRLQHAADPLAASIFGACGAVVTTLTEWLHRARRREERSRRARELLLAVVAHDLRNPLASILFTARMLRSRPDALRRALDTIERAGRRMDHLIRDLLDASVLDHGGRLAVQARNEELAPLLADAIVAAEGAAVEKSITIATELPASLPSVRCDRDRILQVLGNLVSNAVKFTPEGGRVAVRAAMVDGFVRIEVADTGPGIAPADRARVFERYWSARPARGGVGLGLFIAQGIVSAHGGRVWLRSEAGRGTSFFFTLPIAPPAPELHASSAL